MFRGLFIFGAGIYTGIFIAQNYEVQKVQDPATLLNNFKLYLEEVAKENGKK